MKTDFQEIVNYVIQFLLGNGNPELVNFIGYTSDKEKYKYFKIVIYPSGFFDEDIYLSEKSLPELPLQRWEDLPLLFGKPEIQKTGDTTVIYTDIIAGTYFLISRYEEVVRRDVRDEHGRFRGKYSLPFRAGFLNRPIVEEYGRMLRKLLRESGIEVAEPKEGFNSIYLTHDADQIAHYRTFRGMAGAVTRFFTKPYQTYKALQTYFLGIENDPWFTFPWFFDLAFELKKFIPYTSLESIVFVKTGGGELMTDKPIHDIQSKDFRKLFTLCEENNVSIGLHPSYQAGLDKGLIVVEKKLLDEAFGQSSVYTRNHFLRSREPEDFHALLEAGLNEDFTMGYADVAGFRLGTCRAVRWIDPVKMELTSLVLHPITIMDSTLDDERYMKLRTEEAFSFSKKLIDQVRKFNGDLVLLWHNTSVEKNNGKYHRDLYRWIINYLKKR